MASSHGSVPGGFSKTSLEAYSAGSDETFGQVCEPCSEDGRQVEAKGYCCTCSQYLCAECCKYHKKLKTLKHHKLLEGSDFSSSQKSLRLHELCAKHPDQYLEFYCVSDDKPCCKTCRRVDHAGCEDIAAIAVVAKGIKTKSTTIQDLDYMRGLVAEMRTFQTDFKGASKRLDDRNTNNLALLKVFRERLNKRLDELEEATKRDIQAKNDRCKDEVDEVTCSVASAIDSLSARLKQLDKLMKEGDEASVFLTLVKARAIKTECQRLWGTIKSGSGKVNVIVSPDFELELLLSKLTGMARADTRTDRQVPILPLPVYLSALRIAKDRKLQTSRTGVEEKKWVLVQVAVDTSTLSGYGLAWEHEYENFTSGTAAPNLHTAVLHASLLLIDIERQVVAAFREDGVDKFEQMHPDEDMDAYFCIRNPAERLQSIRQDYTNPLYETLVEDSLGHRYPTHLLLSAVLQHYADHYTNMTKWTGIGFEDRETNWVLATPLPWGEHACHFVLDAAKRVNIPLGSISVVHSSEAAMAYTALWLKSKQELKHHFTPGTTYMVLETAVEVMDITVHQVTSSGEMKVLLARRQWYNENFRFFLTEIFGKEFCQLFCQTRGRDFFDMQSAFMNKTATGETVSLKYSSEFDNVCQIIFGKRTREYVSEFQYADRIQVVSDKIRIKSQLWQRFVNHSLDTTTSFLKGAMQDDRLRGKPLSAIILVGNISESSAVYQATRAAYPNMELLLPDNPLLAVQGGAAILGHTIAERLRL